ncbi:UNVERIFIED_CONTAM: hypothetical protein GTU68_035448 [Idotea baltica]|nr:hypothetical protein [Idotea baltica]
MQDRLDADVAAFKREGVVRALRTANVETDVEPTLTVPPHDRRRVKLAYQRTKKSALIGFYGAGTHTIVPVPECKVARPEILASLPKLCDLLRHGAPRKRALAVTVTVSEGGLDVSVAEGKELDMTLREALGREAEVCDLARLVWNGEQIALRRPPVQRFGRVQVVPPPGAFLQASSVGETMLRDLVVEAVGETKSALDLFAGCGAFSLPLAERASVLAIEGEAAMMAALDAGWRNAEGLRAIAVETRDLFRRPLLPEELNKFEAAVFDPPRAGAQAQAAHLAQSRVPVVVGVSCMPGSFARDARVLIDGGYRLERVVPVDQFRWSSHVELVGVFRRT